MLAGMVASRAMPFDCHTHVQFAAFEKDWKEVIDRSLKAGVSIINVGTQRDTSARAVEIANMYERGVYAAIGLHPVHTTRSYHDANELGGGDAAKAFVSRGEEFDHAYYRKLAEDPKVVALGECGLDYYRVIANNANEEGNNANGVWKEKQRAVFFEHVMIAQKTDKALMIHCRPSKGTDDAYEDLLAALKEWQFPADRCVLHFYVGSLAMTKKFLDAGFNFEFGGVITFARDYDEQIRLVPDNRILTETDAPYVSPEPYRGQRNEPVYVAEVVKKLAEIKGISISEVDRITTENAKRIFKII
jgi:TatD DNase family protein